MRTPRRLLKQVRTALLTAFLFGGFINVLMLATPLYTLQVFETVVPLGSIETLVILTVITGAAIIALALLEIVRDTILLRAGLWLDHTLGVVMLENGLKAGVPALEMKRDSRALETLRGFLSGGAVAPMIDGPWVPIFLVALTVLHPLVGAMAAVSALLLALTAALQLVLTDRLQAENAELRERTYSWFGLMVSNAPVAGALGLTRGVADKWERANRAHIAGSYSAGKRASFLKALGRSIRIGSQIALYGLGAWLVVHNEITPGALVASAILLARALAPIEQLAAAIKPASAAWRAYRRLRALPPETPQAILSDAAVAPEVRILLSDVTLFPAGRKSASLRSVSLAIAPGECVGIVGPNGSGKSSLMAILAGVLAPTAGNADLDGLPIVRWQRSGGQPPIGYLPDDPQLVEGTVHENIVRFSDASLMSAAAAAIAAGVHERLQLLPDGYETSIGPGGAGLSANMRRAVALARALHGAPRIIVLDEPELGLDGPSFRALHAALRDFKASGCSLIVSTHDARLLKLTDKVLVMAHGSVLRVGRPEEVLRPTQAIDVDANRITAADKVTSTQRTIVGAA
ncbi:MAG: type I secretion system permease/ATPase [Hyphomicrobiaceae bacterium]